MCIYFRLLVCIIDSNIKLVSVNNLYQHFCTFVFVTDSLTLLLLSYGCVTTAFCHYDARGCHRRSCECCTKNAALLTSLFFSVFLFMIYLTLQPADLQLVVTLDHQAPVSCRASLPPRGPPSPESLYYKLPAVACTNLYSRSSPSCRLHMYLRTAASVKHLV